MTSRVVVLGSANMDLVGTATRLPAPGETVLGREFSRIPGGKGANQAVAVARAGGDCSAIMAIGEDDFGPVLRGAMADAGVDTTLVRVVPGPTGVALIAVDEAGENQILVLPGANARLAGLRDDDRAVLDRADALVCQLEVPTEVVIEAAAVAHAGGATVIINAAPAAPLPPALLAVTDLLVVNHGEAEVVTGLAGASVDELVDALVVLTPRVVLTMGKAGARYGERAGARLSVPAPVVSTVDTTAAGDTFVGALTVAWTEGRSVQAALRWACAAGAACARTLGAATSVPTRDQIDELYHSTYEIE
jgi:ribokinase